MNLSPEALTTIQRALATIERPHPYSLRSARRSVVAGTPLTRMEIVSLGDAHPDWVLNCKRLVWDREEEEWVTDPEADPVEVHCDVTGAATEWEELTPLAEPGGVLWAVRTADGLWRAVPLFGVGGAGGGPLVLVELEQAGGFAGHAGTPCTFAYDIYRWPRGELPPLATEVQPLYGRAAIGRYVQAADESLGVAMYNGEEYVLLLALGEQPAIYTCDPCYEEPEE